MRLTVPLALAAVLLVPSAANAAVTSSVAGTQLTLTGDAASDNITLNVNGAGLITHNLANADLEDSTDFDPAAGKQTLPSNGTVTLIVDGGAGNDNLNVSAPSFAGTPAIQGGDGDDIITGTALVDAIDGGPGNDRITGFRGGETVVGGDGNDVLIWNNGDGNDTFQGGAGIDEILITQGNADDVSAITQLGAVTHFERTSAGPFTVDSVEMEKLTLTSFSGDDTLTTGPGVALPMTVDAGPGNDSITTGDGPDRLIGDRGADTLDGGGGDDMLVWNNGDGNDVMNGGDGVDRVETNLSAGDDVSTLRVEGGRVRYDRTSAGPFNLSIGTAEIFELNTFAGNDTLTSAPGVPITLDADAGAGDDAFNLRDGVQGSMLGGAGNDRAVADANDLIAADVESVDRPAVPPAGAVKVNKKAKVKKGVASIKLSCPAGTSGCANTLTLHTAKAVKLGRVKAPLLLGRKAYSLRAGQTATLKVKLAAGTAKLAKKRKLATTARAGQRASRVTLAF